MERPARAPWAARGEAAEGLDVVRLNLGDERELDVVCAALNCRKTDLIAAVSTVGDRVHDVRRYLEKALGPRSGIETAMRPAARVSTRLPPRWTPSEES